MKKIVSILTIIASLFVFNGCTNDMKEEDQIAGHTFYESDSSGSVTIYFATTGKAQITIDIEGEITSRSNYDYKVKGNVVEIYFDYSSMWKESAKGTLYLSFTYDAKAKTLSSPSFGVFKRIS